MILVLLIVFIVMLVGGGLWLSNDDNPVSWCFTVLGVIGGVVSLIAISALMINVSKLRVIDEQVEMYQEENAIIEAQIEKAIESYQEHEENIFTGVSPDGSITLISLYPDLKSDELVKKQIDTYTNNNDRIRALKEKKIEGTVYRWWLFFGS